MTKIKTPIQYCSRLPKFPLNAFVGILIILNDNKPLAFYPMGYIYNTTQEFLHDMSLLKGDLDDIHISDHALLLPITFSHYWSLKKEYWDHPSLPYKSGDRVKRFFQALQFPDFFQLLVTPGGRIKRQDIFSATLPFSINTPNHDIEQFMSTSDFPVDRTASASGIYTIKKPFGINWTTGEMVAPTQYYPLSLHETN